jgi:uncharacterized peroxidase-related enzyme
LPYPEYEKLARTTERKPSSGSTNLPVVEESDAVGEVAELYDSFRARFGRPDVPGILECFATHPVLLRHMMDLSESLIFRDGHLMRRQKEMIAAFVSTQNACPYCADSHSFFFLVHGGKGDALAAIQNCDIQSAALPEREQALLNFVQKVNRESSNIQKADVDRVRAAGWTDGQIAEAVHVAALFETFNRVANAFGLKSQGLLELYENDDRSSA